MGGVSNKDSVDGKKTSHVNLDLKIPDTREGKNKTYINNLCDDGEEAEVSVCGCPLKGEYAGRGYVHHMFLAKCVKNQHKGKPLYIIFDYLATKEDHGAKFRYAILKKKDVYKCQKSTHTIPLSDLRHSCEKAVRGKVYDMRNFNCNHFVIAVYKSIWGEDISFDDKCKCVTNNANWVGEINKELGDEEQEN